MTTREFFQNNLDYDKSFLDTILDTYKTEMNRIAKMFLNTNENYIICPALTIPNEIYDFLDHNGFTVEYEGSNVTLRRLHPKKYMSGGWVEYSPVLTGTTSGPIATTTTTTYGPLDKEWYTAEYKSPTTISYPVYSDCTGGTYSAMAHDYVQHGLCSTTSIGTSIPTVDLKLSAKQLEEILNNIKGAVK